MFKLTSEELDRAKEALEIHGIMSFLPSPPEWLSIADDWKNFRSNVVNFDLDIYKPYTVFSTYVRKNEKFVRTIEFVHPQDIVIYTALTLILRDAIEDARLAPSVKKSFSYRAHGAKKNALYKTSGQYQKYRDRTEERLELKKTKFVTTADIAQFFPHIYQHRLANALEAAAQDQRQLDATRVLEKLLSRFSSGKSYGIPTGPYASRTLAEALLIDLDAALHQEGIDFVRWMDDLTVFTKTKNDAQQAIGFISSWLHSHHGLILNQQKTEIYNVSDFMTEVWKTYDEEHSHFRELVKKIKSNGYDDDEDLDEEDEIDPDELSEVMTLALTIGSEPKHGLIRYILDNVIFREEITPEIRKGAIKRMLDNFELLEPVFDSIAKSLIRSDEFSEPEIRSFCAKVLKYISERPLFISGHFESWVHWLIGESGCTSLATKLKARLTSQNDPIVRREILLALSKIAARADVLFIKTDFPQIGEAERIPAIIASKKLGKDERKHWRTASGITDWHEKKAFSI